MPPNDSANRERLSIDPATMQTRPATAQPGYYPGYSTLRQQAYWDAATREVVRKRVEEVPSIRFFDEQEAGFMSIVCDHLLPQDDRDLAHRIPVLPYIDERLFEGRTPGYRFESMPPDDGREDMYALPQSESNRNQS